MFQGPMFGRFAISGKPATRSKAMKPGPGPHAWAAARPPFLLQHRRFRPHKTRAGRRQTFRYAWRWLPQLAHDTSKPGPAKLSGGLPLQDARDASRRGFLSRRSACASGGSARTSRGQLRCHSPCFHSATLRLAGPSTQTSLAFGPAAVLLFPWGGPCLFHQRWVNEKAHGPPQRENALWGAKQTISAGVGGRRQPEGSKTNVYV